MKIYKKHITRIEQLLDSVNLPHLKGWFYHDISKFRQEVEGFLKIGSKDTTKHRQMLEIRDILNKYEIKE